METNWLTVLDWIATILALIGYYLNIKQMKVCFIVWIISNFGLITINVVHGIYGQATLWVVYTIMSVYGYYAWSKKERLKE